MKTVQWPDFAPYGMALIMRRTDIGRPAFQLYRSHQYPQFEAGFQALGFRQNRAGDWVRLSDLGSMSQASIQAHFPLVSIKPTPTTIISPELAAQQRAAQRETVVEQNDAGPADDLRKPDDSGGREHVDTQPEPGEPDQPSADDGPAATIVDWIVGGPVMASRSQWVNASPYTRAYLRQADPVVGIVAPDSDDLADEEAEVADNTPVAADNDETANNEPNEVTTNDNEANHGVDLPNNDSGTLESNGSGARDSDDSEQHAEPNADDRGAESVGSDSSGEAATSENAESASRDDLSGTPVDGEPDTGHGSRSDDAAISGKRLNYALPAYDPNDSHSESPLDRRRIALMALGTLIELDDATLDSESVTEGQLEAIAAFNGWSNALHGSSFVSPSAVISSLPAGTDWMDTALDYGERARTNMSMVTSYYTPAPIVDAVWAGIRKTGFDGGNILDPAVGHGIFIGRSGDDGRAYNFHGIDIDPVTTRMAHVLYPRAAIHNKPFEQFTAPDGSYDLAVTNVPFDTLTINDGHYSREFPKLHIHDYYFLRALDLVRPGGMVAFITTYGTLDKEVSSIRESIADRANLVTAYRLPSGIFGGTDVGADLLFLQKRTPDMEPDDRAWTQTTVQELDWPGHGTMPLKMSRYFVDNPSHVIGQLQAKKGQFDYRVAAEVEDRRELPRMLVEFSEQLTASIPADIYTRHDPANKLDGRNDEPEVFVPESFKVQDRRAKILPAGCFVLNGAGTLCQLEAQYDSDHDDPTVRMATEANVNKAMEGRLKLLVPLRDAALDTLDAQQIGCTDSQLVDDQAALTKAYDAFTKKYGPLNRKSNGRSILAEPYSALLLSLEHYDQETETATKTPVFSERTIGAATEPTEAANVTDALMVSLNAYGAPHLGYMAQLLGDDATEESVATELEGQIFFDPASNEWQIREKYLSGNIRRKLDFAQSARELDERYQANVDALEAAMPEPLTPSQVSVGMGSPWVPMAFYEQFLSDLSGCSFDKTDIHARTPVEVTYSDAAGAFSIELRHSFHRNRDYAAMQDWETGRADFKKICDAALNNRSMSFTMPDANGNRVPDKEATLKANTVVKDMRSRFEQWVKQDASHADHITDLYNEHVNIWVEPNYDGSHLTFPGLAATESLRKHQADFVWRTIQDGNALAAHVVGAGKTAALIAAAMECKRLGIARKPIFSLPKAVLMQFASSINRFYPAADVLVVTNDDLHAQNRNKFFARVATHNWDAVVITHDAFERISLSPETQERYITAELVELQNALDSTENRSDERTLQRRLQKLITRLDKVAKDERKDKGAVFFEHLGCDMLLVDEAHRFKNLAITTTMTNTPGINTQGSKRASDLHMKTQYLMDKAGDERGIVFATGTPITNTMAELYVMSRYLKPSSLREMGLSNFDAWAATFGRVQTQLERSPDGSGYRIHGRFSQFVNVPELIKVFRQVADVKMQKDLNLPIPKRKTVKHVVEPPTMLTAFMRSLAYRAKKAGHLADRETDNILAVATDGRHASLDLRTLSPDMSAIVGKIDEVVATVERRYFEEADDKGVQVIFCDLSVPRKDRWSFYDACRKRLVDVGIPDDEMAFIHDAKTDAAKERLFEKAQKGQLRIVFGSTEKLGTGVNIQDRISDLHDIDPPWRPADIEQRHGRALRQGNMYDEVEVHSYISRDTYDEFMFEAIKRKADFIAQALTNPDQAQRMIEEQADPEYAEIMALSTGNPLIKEKVDLESSIQGMQLEANMHHDRQHRARFQARSLESTLEVMNPRIERLEADIASREQEPDKFLFTAPEPVEKDSAICDIADQAVLAKYVFGVADALNCRQRGKRDIGTYAGLTFALEGGIDLNGKPMVSLVRKGNEPATTHLTGNPKGIASQIRHLTRGMDEALDKQIERRDEKATALAQLRAHEVGPFPRAQELEDARSRLIEVDRALTTQAAEENQGQAYPPEIMRALVKMMHMKDRNGLPLVPMEMLSPQAIDDIRSEIALQDGAADSAEQAYVPGASADLSMDDYMVFDYEDESELHQLPPTLETVTVSDEVLASQDGGPEMS